MADILIRGLDMPTEQYGKMVITLYPDGHAVEYVGDMGRVWDIVPLPEGYGRLIDADALLNECCDVIEDHSGLDYVDPCPIWGYSVDMIRRAPTIVPAEGGIAKDIGVEPNMEKVQEVENDNS